MSDAIDAKVFTLIAAGTTTAVGILKKFFPKWMEGKEDGFAQLLPIIFTVSAKASGLFKGTEWLDALLFAVGGGILAGVAHDKIVNPAKRAASFLGIASGKDVKKEDK